MENIQVLNNKDAQRFEVRLAKSIAKLDYRIAGDIIYFLHTEVPENQEGKGLGSRLAEVALNYARAEGYSVKVWCPFVNAYLQRHPRYRDLQA